MQKNREADAYILFYNLTKNSQITITKINKVAENNKVSMNKINNDISMHSIKGTSDSYMSFESFNNESDKYGKNLLNVPLAKLGKYFCTLVWFYLFYIFKLTLTK